MQQPSACVLPLYYHNHLHVSFFSIPSLNPAGFLDFFSVLFQNSIFLFIFFFSPTLLIFPQSAIRAGNPRLLHISAVTTSGCLLPLTIFNFVRTATSFTPRNVKFSIRSRGARQITTECQAVAATQLANAAFFPLLTSVSPSIICIYTLYRFLPLYDHRKNLLDQSRRKIDSTSILLSRLRRSRIHNFISSYKRSSQLILFYIFIYYSFIHKFISYVIIASIIF